MGFFESIKKSYENDYKKWMLFPFILVVLALLQVGIQFATTGDFVHKGISLKGGSAITLENANIPLANLELFLDERFPQFDVSVRSLSSAGEVIGLTVESSAQTEGDIDSILAAIGEKVSVQQGSYSVEVIGSSLGTSFFRQTITALAVAFVLMGCVVFFYFRAVGPSMAVIVAAFSDIIVTLAIFNLTGIKLSTAGVAAFLMLVGYSVDTDILLSSRLLKRQDGTHLDRIYGAMKTGLTMTATTLAAVLVGFFFVQSDIVKQIMLILFIGLIIDMIMTWVQNVGLLRLYLEKKHKGGSA